MNEKSSHRDSIIPGIKVFNDQYGPGVTTSFVNADGYISVEFDNIGLVDLDYTQLTFKAEIQEIHQFNTYSNPSETKISKTQETDIAIIESLKSIETRKCKEKNLVKTILRFQNIITRGKVRLEREKVINETVQRLIKNGVLSRKKTNTNTWIKLEPKHVDYLKKKFRIAEKNKKDDQLTLPLLSKPSKSNFAGIHGLGEVGSEQSLPIYKNEATQEDLFQPTRTGFLEHQIETHDSKEYTDSHHQFVISPTGELIESNLEISTSNTLGKSRPDVNETSFDHPEVSTTTEQLIDLINKTSNLKATLELNTVKLQYSSNSDAFDFEGKLNPFEQSIIFSIKFDLNKQKVAELLDLAGQYHFSSIIGVTLFKGNDRKLVLRKSIPGFYTPRQSLESLLCMTSDIKEVKKIMESTNEHI